MKLILPLCLAIGLASLTGCTTTSTGSKVPDPIVLSAVAQSAGALGTTIWLQTHPQDRPAFLLARTSLKALVAAGSGSPADLQAALSSLPISQLQGRDGSVVVTSAVVLLDAAGKELAKLDKAQLYSGFVLPVAQGLLAGLDQALGPQ